MLCNNFKCLDIIIWINISVTVNTRNPLYRELTNSKNPKSMYIYFFLVFTSEFAIYGFRVFAVTYLITKIVGA